MKKKKFQDLVDEFTRCAHDSLLQEGAKGLRNAMYAAMNTAIQWHIEKQKPIEKLKIKFNKNNED